MTLRFLLMMPLLLSAGERLKPTDWPAHAATAKAGIGAEYLVHSVMSENNNIIVKGYLVIEVLVEPAESQRFLVSQQHFFLRINGKKQLVFSQTPGMAAASLKYEDWEQHPGVAASAGMGDAAVILGRKQPDARFPGDPRPRQNRLPRPPKAPELEERSGLDREQKLKPEELVVDKALPEGDTSGPVRGYLYFAYKGKITAIKKLELVYQGPAGEASLPLL